ncbi:WD40 repeat-like protein [Piromyces finnis]|uniref:TBC1 domain family member 31 n=1 Tax=Piromyces finnis TaxID=1754191 RepID=A0A1Y1V728_9FUNG|nr:WD40 repeat-like protein [Piromyces finnis]|eukprot:ORX48655.1 WD40 repeat-like protein [Piromyces finnis]
MYNKYVTLINVFIVINSKEPKHKDYQRNLKIKNVYCLLSINNSKLIKNNSGIKKDIVNDISFCSICVDYGILKCITKDLSFDDNNHENNSILDGVSKDIEESNIAKLQHFKMGAIDQKGNIYIFDFERNTYNLIARSGISANCISFNPYNKNEIIVGHTNKSIRSYNIGSKKLAVVLSSYHHSEPYAFSFHPHQPYLLSTSFKDVIVWDLSENSCLRVLIGIQDSEIQNAIFSKSGQQIIASFLNGNILIWNSETFNMEWKISLEALKNENIIIPKKHFPTNLQNTSLLIMSKDNTQLVYGGMGSTLFIWNIIEKVLQYELNLTILNSSALKRIEYVGNKKMVVVLSNDGNLVFINTKTGSLIAFRNEIKCSSFTLSNDGEFIFLILNQKSKVLIYSTSQLINYQKPVNIKSLKESSKETEGIIEVGSNTTTQVRSLYETIDQHKLPENKTEYELYSSKDIHPAVINFKKKYPLKIYRVLRSMEKIMSMLCYWSPVFENIDYLPNMIFPFVKIYENDTFSCFEILLTVIINYCQKWWEFYPNPPIECLDMLESLLSYHDKELYNHFVKYNITSQYYGWELVNNFFSDILSKNEWLCLWDNILTSCDPSYLYYFVIAYLKYLKKSILRITDIEDFMFFIHKENPCQFSKIIRLTNEVKKCTPEDLKFKKILKPYYSLSSNTNYPIFNEYPKYIINYQTKLKEKIRLEEEEYLKKK